MRAFPKVLALALSVAVASPAVAGFYISAQVGGGGSSYASGSYSSSSYSSGYRVGIGAGKGTGAYWGKKQRRYHRPYRPNYGGVYLYGRRYDDRVRYREQPAPVAPDPVPEPPVVAAPVEPATPPDPWGPLRTSPARGVAVTPAYAIGEALASNLPHVTLDWRRFELPEPPPGQIYARVKRDVLLITADERVVKSVVPPG